MALQKTGILATARGAHDLPAGLASPQLSLGQPPTIVRATMAATSEIQASNVADSTAEEQASHELNAAGTHPKGVLRWGYFLLLNAIAGVLAVAIFVGVFYADGLDPYLRGTYDWLLAHPGVTSFFAFSPLAASLLVGWGYSQRAKKRKAAAAKAEAARMESAERAKAAA